MIRSAHDYRIILRTARGEANVSARATVTWPVEIDRAKKIMAKTENPPNSRPMYVVLRAPDCNLADELRGDLYLIGDTPTSQSEIVVAWGDYEFSADAVSAWHLRDSETFKNPDGYLLMETSGYFWRIIHAGGGLGNAPAWVSLRPYRS